MKTVKMMFCFTIVSLLVLNQVISVQARSQNSFGIVEDRNTGLQWVAGPDRNTTWDEAKSWVQNLTLNGGGWRLPTMNELASLHREGAGRRNMISRLNTTGWWVWSGETEDPPYYRYFDFYGSGHRRTGLRNDCPNGRAFAVRSRGEGGGRYQAPAQTVDPISQMLLLSLKELRYSNPSIKMANGKYSYERKTQGVITFYFYGYMRGTFGEFAIVVATGGQEFKSIMAAIFKDPAGKLSQLE